MYDQGIGAVEVEDRVVVLALSVENPPVVETGRRALEMPLADQRRLVAGRAEEFGEGGLRAVEGLQAKCEIEVDGRFTPYTHVCLEQEMGRA